MLDHLEMAHNVKDLTRRYELASKREDIMQKKAWSCGFCGTALTHFTDRLNHIGWHFEQGQTIREWDTTKVILGLLQQPDIIKAWKEKLASLPPWVIHDRCWEKHETKALRRDLEIGPCVKKTALDLAGAAFAASKANF